MLEVGVCIKIKRTDGSVHEAVISDIRGNDQLVFVEWVEGNEYKGKEISYRDVYLHNPDLISEEQISKANTARSRTSTKDVCDEKKRSKVLRSTITTPSARSSLNPIKEVERLKKNRDERRMMQAKKQEEKQLIIKMNPDNPNWEYQVMIEKFKRTLVYSRISEMDSYDYHQITVCVRKRPLNNTEISRKDIDVVTIVDKETVIMHEPKCKVDLTKFIDNQTFKFDYAFDDKCSNDFVYKFTAKPLVETIFEGGVATCFAYGQTGSGKTYTMGGNAPFRSSEYSTGIYAKTAIDVFELLHSPRYSDLNLTVTASYYEIYREKLYDLLAGKAPLKVFEDMKQQVNIVGLTERKVETVEEVLSLIREGNMARTSGKTTANAMSSRSHAVFQIGLRTGSRRHGKFCLIDLAGNERGGQSVTKRAKVEGADINKSLLALKECIRALGRRENHLPFRGSKLTQVLRDAFVGEKARTCMIAMLSPGLSVCKNTLNTLRYADRVKEIAAGGDCDETMHNEIDRDQDSRLSWFEVKEKELRDNLSKYIKCSQTWNKKEKELSENAGYEKFPTKDFVSSLNEILNERLLHIHRMLAVAADLSKQFNN